MTRKDDSPSLILRITPKRQIIPATATDMELLDGFRVGTDLVVTEAKKPRSSGLAAWWLLMGAVSAYSDEWHSPRALSNALLLQMNLYESEKLIGGVRKTPMSLTEFNEDELFRLVEVAKMVIARDITPEIDPDLIIKEKRRGSF